MINIIKIQCCLVLLGFFSIPLYADPASDQASIKAEEALTGIERNPVVQYSRATIVLGASADCSANLKLVTKMKSEGDLPELLRLIQENEVSIALIRLIIEKMAVADKKTKEEQYDYNESKAKKALAESIEAQRQIWSHYYALKPNASEGAVAEVLDDTLGRRSDLLPVVAGRPSEVSPRHP